RGFRAEVPDFTIPSEPDGARMQSTGSENGHKPSTLNGSAQTGSTGFPSRSHGGAGPLGGRRATPAAGRPPLAGDYRPGRLLPVGALSRSLRRVGPIDC